MGAGTTSARGAAALALGVAAGALLLAAAPAQATIPSSLSAPANCGEIEPAPGESVFKCDDGVPTTGGAVPNLTGAAAVTVPAKYGGDGYTGLPTKAADAATMPGASPADGTIALDTNVWLPSSPPPAGGYPLVVLMHGCCGGNKTGWEADSVDAAGEKWHYNSAWFALRGYAVLTYTARGFVDGQNRGSTGHTQLDSRRFEINDYQHLACQLYGASAGPAAPFDDITGHDVEIDTGRVVVTGGSYGGGFTWLALTDPRWSCTADTGSAAAMSLAAAAPKYGWTDLAYTLVPNGTHSQNPGELPATDGCDTGPRQLDGSACPGGGAPVGVPKTSIVSGLFVTGNVVTGNHTTFPPNLAEAFACLTSTYPTEGNPACVNTLATTLPEFLRDRSAYYQNDFFAQIASDPAHRVPVFNAATFSDPLFPSYENRRMINRLLATVPGYPIRNVFGDYQHFALNKAKEWGDICDTGDARGRHVCELGDYPVGDFDAAPAGLVRTGITTRLNEFIDHYAQPSANPAEPQPPFDVTATLRTCAPAGAPGEDEPGAQFTASTFEALAPNTLTAELPGPQETLSKVPTNTHALNADPVANQQANGNRCPRETGVAGLGVASYATDPLPAAATMIGSTAVDADFALTGSSEGLQLNARLYDLAPDGTAVMIDRGTRRITAAEAAAGHVAWQLHGNGWRFEAGHRVRIELAQDDQPFVRSTDVPSSLAISGVRLRIPIREQSAQIGGGPEPKPPTGPGGVAGRCGNTIAGSKRGERLAGTPLGDRIKGRGGADRLSGRGGRDCVAGGRGGDRVRGGPARDRLVGGNGRDRIDARGGGRDRVRCGRGRDRAVVDRRDRVVGCERVRSKKLSR